MAARLTFRTALTLWAPRAALVFGLGVGSWSIASARPSPSGPPTGASRPEERPSAEASALALAAHAAAAWIVGLGLGSGAWWGARVLHRRRAQAADGPPSREPPYRAVFDATDVAYLIVDADGRVTDANPAAVQLLGREPDALLGQPARELLDGPEDPRPLQIAGHRPDGARFEARITRRALDGGGALLVLVDTSPLIAALEQERSLQAQVAHAQRLEAIGRLAGGVAHDVNNMLTVVQGQAQLALEALDEGDLDAVRTSLQDILQASERTSGLTKQLLALGRRQPVQPVNLDLRAHLEGMRRMLEKLTPDHVVLRWSWPDGPCAARLDPTQLEQLTVNLVLNAVAALPRGGTLQIGLARVRGEAPHLPSGALEDGEWVDLSFEDDGEGMSEAVQARVFEPFFTTRASAEGTGLGLSVVHGIVRSAGGRYFVRSAEGEGTRFDFLVPAAPAPAPAKPTPGPRARSTGTGRILFVEDEAPVRRTTARLLERAGYAVTVCAHPFEALERARSADAPFDLLITDVMMPDMNGRELGDAIRERWPRQPMLFVSGYTSDIMLDLDDRQDFVEKPFEAEDLLAVARRLIDAARAEDGADD
jgi:PAS domain S-box-containing protein